MAETEGTETTTTTLDELFERDPLELSDSDLRLMVAEFRRKRATWALEDSSAKKEGRRPKRRATLTKEQLDKITLDSINLDPSKMKSE